MEQQHPVGLMKSRLKIRVNIRMGGGVWRDTIRRQLRFASLRVDFRSIVVDDETELCAFSLSRLEQAMPWLDVVKYIGKFDTLCFKYTLEVMMISEDEDFVYEYDGRPSAIVDDITISTNIDTSLIDDSVTTSTISSLMASYEDISLALLRFE